VSRPCRRLLKRSSETGKKAVHVCGAEPCVMSELWRRQLVLSAKFIILAAAFTACCNRSNHVSVSLCGFPLTAGGGNFLHVLGVSG
jgi:hypothetical protein